MARIKTCNYCGKEYESKSHAQKFCSAYCRERSRYVKRVGGVKKLKCIVCSKEFESLVEEKKFCSSRCRTKYHRTKYKEKAKTINCAFCGKKIKPTRKEQKFCSGACSARYRSKQSAELKKRREVELDAKLKQLEEELRELKAKRAEREALKKLEKSGIDPRFLRRGESRFSRKGDWAAAGMIY